MRVNAVAQYLFSLTVVVACYFVYLKVAVPWIEGQPAVENSSRVLPTTSLVAPPLNKDKLIPLLPKDAWELGSCKTITTPTGTIMFKTFERQEDGTLKVAPFTLISGLGEAGLSTSQPTLTHAGQATPLVNRKPPTVLRCVKGANLKFDRPVKDAIQSGAKLELARLTGDVDIYRPATRADKSDLLHVLTRNVQVDRYRIYTLEQVAFSYGPHRGRGRNLLIDLLHGKDVLASQQDFSSIEGVSRLELAFLDYLRIEPTQRSNAIELKASSRNQPPPRAVERETGQSKSRANIFQQDSPLEVACSGPFVFDFQANQLSLQDDVLVKQLDHHQNRIQCDRLTMTFFDSDEVNSRRALPQVSPREQDQTQRSDLRLKDFVAVGSPAVVVSNAHPARFTADELSYNAQTEQVVGRSRGSRNVSLVTTEHQIVTKQLQYTLTDDGSLGEFFSDGAGRLLKLGKLDKDELFVTWENQLATQALPTQPGLPQRQRITIEGAATVRRGADLSIHAQSMAIVIDQQKDIDGKWQYEPVQVVARTDVRFSTPKLQGRTQKLTANWIPGTPSRQTNRPHRVGRVSFELPADTVDANPQQSGPRPFPNERFVQPPPAAQSPFANSTQVSRRSQVRPPAPQRLLESQRSRVSILNSIENLPVAGRGQRNATRPNATRQPVAPQGETPPSLTPRSAIPPRRQQANVRQVGLTLPIQAPQAPTASTPTKPFSARSVPAKQTRLVFRGDEMITQLTQRTDPRSGKPQSALVDLVVRGNVNVVQQERPVSASDGGKFEDTLAMSGDDLRIIPQENKVPLGTDSLTESLPVESTQELYRAAISSSVEPARIATNDFRLAGAQINLDQRQNKIWVQGTGDIRFKSPASTANDTSTLLTRPPFGSPLDASMIASNGPTRPNQSMVIRWQGGMIFDGASIYFEHGVKFQSEEQTEKQRTLTLGEGEALKVELTRAVDLSNPSRQTPQLDKIEVRELVFVDWISESERAFQIRAPANPGLTSPLDNPANPGQTPLRIKHAIYDLRNQKQSQQVVTARQATVDVARGKLSAQGPGTIALHQLKKQTVVRNVGTDQSPTSSLAGTNSNQTNRRSAATKSKNPLARFSGQNNSGPISFVQVNFDGSMEVDQQSKTVNVKQRIRTAYRDVKEWDRKVDPDDAIRKLPGTDGVVVLTCESMQLGQWQPRNATEPVNELIATGNVHIDSSELETTADRVSYNQANDMLVIEGTPRSDANIWYRQRQSRQVQHLVAQKLWYRLSDQSYEILQVKSISSRN